MQMGSPGEGVRVIGDGRSKAHAYPARFVRVPEHGSLITAEAIHRERILRRPAKGQAKGLCCGRRG